ncbi:MAG: DMT family transporter [Gammaproteobacteria bacterium]|nr:DMT family transporter [Gammaproteobacteria bacterium]MDH5731582.1 DMT family transporter [Gammaproteobacteria bacterium]
MIATIKNIRSNNTWFGIACVLLATIGLSFKAIFIKLAYAADPRIDAISVLNIRMILALPFFALMLFFSRQTNATNTLNRQSFMAFLLLGGVGFYASAFLDYSALFYIPANLERLILFLYPTFVVIISFFTHRSSVNRYTIIAVVVSYVGIMVVFFDQAAVFTQQSYTGISLVFAAAIVFAIYTVASVPYIIRFGSIRFTSYAMFAASLAIFLHGFAAHGFQVFYQDLKIYSLILPMAIFSTVLPMFLMAEGVKRIGAASSSIISTSGPVITIFFAYVLLNESFGLIQLIGGMLVILGVFFVARKK